MPKRKRSSPTLPRVLVALAIAALLLFVAGELWRRGHRDSVRLALSRLPAVGDPARVTQVLGRSVREGLLAAGVSADSIREEVRESGPTAVRWRVGLKPDASTLQANYAVARRIEALGAEVLSGRESRGPGGETVVTLLLGLSGRATHEIVLVRGALAAEPSRRPDARLAIVVFGFGEDLGPAQRFFAQRAPFSVALAPGSRGAPKLFKAAHESSREVVLHLPLEPINYPSLNPGPGTLLVTMSPARVTGLTRRYLDQADPVVAVANHMGSLATQDMAVMGAVYRELKRRHLPFVHLQPTPGSVCRKLAADQGVLYEQPGAVIDAEARGSSTAALDARWKQVLEQARERGRLSVWVRATPLTRAWLERATDPGKLAGVDLVPLSAVLRRPAAL